MLPVPQGLWRLTMVVLMAVSKSSGYVSNGQTWAVTRLVRWSQFRLRHKEPESTWLTNLVRRQTFLCPGAERGAALLMPPLSSSLAPCHARTSLATRAQARARPEKTYALRHVPDLFKIDYGLVFWRSVAPARSTRGTDDLHQS